MSEEKKTVQNWLFTKFGIVVDRIEKIGPAFMACDRKSEEKFDKIANKIYWETHDCFSGEIYKQIEEFKKNKK